MSRQTAKQITELADAARQVLANVKRNPLFDRLRTALAPFGPAAVTVNEEQELYVIPCGEGYTCLGFDVLLARYNAVAAWLRDQGLVQDYLPPEARGTMRAYTAYRTLMSRAQAHCQRNNLRCPAELTPQLTGLEGKRVEVVDCDGQRRRFTVGRSCGWMPCHLALARCDSRGGAAVHGL